MKDVIVLMSTYNGQEFIVDQLDSILNQDYDGSIKILIRDDGSVDTTTSIISNFKTTKNRTIDLIKENNIGPQRSFLKLIQKADLASYYFFSDQDDIWYKSKISDGVRYLRASNTPICYCTNYDIYNMNTEQRRTHIIKEQPNFNPLKVIFYNQIPGCTMGFNQALMLEIKKLRLNNVMMHDSMVLSFCASIGEIVYNPESSIIHRIHGSNVVGEGHKRIIPHQWLLDKIKLVLNKENYDISDMAKEFINSNKVKTIYQDDLILLRDYRNSIKNTIRLLKHPDSHSLRWDRTTLSIRSKILFHVF